VPHIRALRDRETPILIEADEEAWWEYTVYLALCKGLLRTTEDRRHDIPLRIQNEAIQWFTWTAWQQTSLSPRRLAKIAGVLMSDHAARVRLERCGRLYDPRAKEEDLNQFLRRDHVDPRPSPYAPPIFLRPRMGSQLSEAIS
jgi:hypothetical protein